jgi:hypothetical protein
VSKQSDIENSQQLTISAVAASASVTIEEVREAVKAGHISPSRDPRGLLRFSKIDVFKLASLRRKREERSRG